MSLKAPAAPRILVSEEELEALLGPAASALKGAEPAPGRLPAKGKRSAKADVDTGFKYRTLFMAMLALLVTIRVGWLFLEAARNYQADDPATVALLSYALHRLGFTFLFFTLYTYSYLRDWHFKAVAVLAVVLAVMGLLLDYYKGYSTAIGPPLGTLIVLTLLRFSAIYCLLMNALNAHRAPPMPRRPWS